MADDESAAMAESGGTDQRTDQQTKLHMAETNQTFNTPKLEKGADPLMSGVRPGAVLPSFASIKSMRPSDYLDIASYPMRGVNQLAYGQFPTKPQALPSVMSLSPAAMSKKSTSSTFASTSTAGTTESSQHLYVANKPESLIGDQLMLTSISYKTMPAVDDHRPPSLPSFETPYFRDRFGQVQSMSPLVGNSPNPDSKVEWTAVPSEYSTVNVSQFHPLEEMLSKKAAIKQSSSPVPTEYQMTQMLSTPRASAQLHHGSSPVTVRTTSKIPMSSLHPSPPTPDASASKVLEAWDQLSSGISSLKHSVPPPSMHTPSIPCTPDVKTGSTFSVPSQGVPSSSSQLLLDQQGLVTSSSQLKLPMMQQSALSPSPALVSSQVVPDASAESAPSLGPHSLPGQIVPGVMSGTVMLQAGQLPIRQGHHSNDKPSIQSAPFSQPSVVTSTFPVGGLEPQEQLRPKLEQQRTEKAPEFVVPINQQHVATSSTRVQSENQSISLPANQSKPHIQQVILSSADVVNLVGRSQMSDAIDSKVLIPQSVEVPVQAAYGNIPVPSGNLLPSNQSLYVNEPVNSVGTRSDGNPRGVISDVGAQHTEASVARPLTSDVSALLGREKLLAGVSTADVMQMLQQSMMPESPGIMSPLTHTSYSTPVAADQHRSSPVAVSTPPTYAQSPLSMSSSSLPVMLSKEDRHSIARLSAENVAKLLLEPQEETEKQWSPRTSRQVDALNQGVTNPPPVSLDSNSDLGMRLPTQLYATSSGMSTATSSHGVANILPPSPAPFTPFSNPMFNKPLTSQQNRCLSSELLQALGLWTSTPAEPPVKKETPPPPVIVTTQSPIVPEPTEPVFSPGVLADKVMETIEKLSFSVEQENLKRSNLAQSTLQSYTQPLPPETSTSAVASKTHSESHSSQESKYASGVVSSSLPSQEDNLPVPAPKVKLGEITLLPGVYTDTRTPVFTGRVTKQQSPPGRAPVVVPQSPSTKLPTMGDNLSDDLSGSYQNETNVVESLQITGVTNLLAAEGRAVVGIKEEPVDIPHGGDNESRPVVENRRKSTSSTAVSQSELPLFTSSIAERTKTKRLCRYVDKLVSNAQQLSSASSSESPKTKAKSSPSPTKSKTFSSDNESSETVTREIPRTENNKKSRTPDKSSIDGPSPSKDQDQSASGKDPKMFVAKPLLLPAVRYTLEVIHRCDMCRQEFDTFEELQQHTPTHANEKVFMCTFCNLLYESPAQLREHMKVDHNVHDKMTAFECRFCTRQFPDEKKLSNHLKTHSVSKLQSAAMKAHAANRRKNNSKPTLSKLFSLKGGSRRKRKYIHLPAKLKRSQLSNISAKDESLADDIVAETEDKVETPRRVSKRPRCPKTLTVEDSSGSEDDAPVLKRARVAYIPPGRKRHTCEVCSKAFITPYKLRRHMLVHTKSGAVIKQEVEEETEYKCSHCSEVLTSALQLNEHLKTHTSETPFQCVICSKTYAKAAAFKYHMRTHESESEPVSEPKQFICKECGKSYSEAATLRNHMLKHSGQAKYQCEICDRKFTESSGYRYHIKTHSGERPHQCPFCDKSYIDGSSLTVHLRKHSGERPYICPVCNKGFAARGHLKTHLKIHSGHKPYKCGICFKEFTLEPSLTIHMRVHTRETPYSCSICGKKFNQIGNMKRHELAHSGQTPYECEICNSRFTYSGTLKTHQRIHTGERPFSCPICNKTFNRSGHVTRHVRVHSGEKPYKCKQCSKAYTQSGDLKRHVKAVHLQGEEPDSNDDPAQFVNMPAVDLDNSTQDE